MKKNMIALTMICMCLGATQVSGTTDNKTMKWLSELEKKIKTHEEKSIKNGDGTIKRLYHVPPLGAQWITEGKVADGCTKEKVYSPESRFALKVIGALKKLIEKSEQKKSERTEKAKRPK